MSQLALTLVLCAALLHALWNAIVKGADDRALALAAVSAAHVGVGSIMLLVAPGPTLASWPYILASTLTHYAYYAFLFHSYRIGDFSQVYPIAHGIAPVLVALGAQIFAAEFLPLGAWFGLIAVSLGIAVLALSGGGLRADAAAIRAALATGVMISCYSVAHRYRPPPFRQPFWLYGMAVLSGVTGGRAAHLSAAPQLQSRQYCRD